MFKGQHYTDKIDQIQFQLYVSRNSETIPSLLIEFKLYRISNVQTQ